MNKKKGISAVVATVLIILITVAAVTIIWTAIIPMIKTQLEEGTVCLNAVTALAIENKGYTCFNAADIKVQVSHGKKNVSLVGIQFLISKGGDTTSVEVTSGLPDTNGERVITVTYAAGNPESISIAPIISLGNTEITCDASAPVMLDAC